MSAGSAIEWTDATWNPTTGCSLVSEGCRNCYAMRMARRFDGQGRGYDGTTEMGPNGPRWTGKVLLHPDRLEQPLRWRKPRMVFVDSMSDLFHPDVPFTFVDGVFAAMALSPRHTFQVLTKRPERAAEYFTSSEAGRDRRDDIALAAFNLNGEGPDGLLRFTDEQCMVQPDRWPLPNVWIGTSVEDQAAADERIPHLLRIPAAVRFLSCEPLLGPVDLHASWLPCPRCRGRGWYLAHLAHMHQTPCADCARLARESGVRVGPTQFAKPGPRLGWVIVGGESGPGARPMHPAWARSLRDQCAAAGVPFFFKQWGHWQPVCNAYDEHIDEFENGRGELHAVDTDGSIPRDYQPSTGAWLMGPVGKKAAGRLLDGREWNEFPGAVS